VKLTARPFVLAYLLLMGLTMGVMVRRGPGAQAVPAVAPARPVLTPAQSEPLWIQLFRPSQRTALLILRLGLPLLAELDGSQQEQKVSLLVYRTGPRGEPPKTFMQSLFPFLAERPTPSVEVPPIAKGDGKTAPADDGPPDPKVPPRSPSAKPEPAPLNGGLPLVGIYHTHDWESYISEFPGLQVKHPRDLEKIQSFDHRQRTVVDLGKHLATLLSQQGVVTVHSEQRHQRLNYENAYLLSRTTAEQILKDQPSTRVLIDIHRDAAPDFTPVVQVKGQEVAQIRCVIGQAYPGWERNKALCQRLMDWLGERFPGLPLPVLVKADERYNQDVLPGAILLEIGSATNGYDQADRAIGLLAEGLSALMHSEIGAR
jgi:stage II sporulation protein P